MPDDRITSPQTTGDLIGRAIRVYRANLRNWVPLLLWPTVVILIGRVIYQVAIITIKPSDPSPSAILTGAAGVAVGAVIILSGRFFLWQRQLAFVRLANGLSTTYKDASEYMWKRKWTILGVSILCGLMVIAVGCLWMLEIVASGILVKVMPIPAILAMTFGFIGFMVSVFFILFAFYFSLVVGACESGGPGTVVSRGFSMSSKTFFRSLWAGIAISLTVNLLAVPFWLPMMVLGGFDTLRTGTVASAATGLPIYWNIALAVWESLVEMVTQPILYLAYGYYYYDLRLRYEGIDVVETLDAIKLKNKQHELLH